MGAGFGEGQPLGPDRPSASGSKLAQEVPRRLYATPTVALADAGRRAAMLQIEFRLHHERDRPFSRQEPRTSNLRRESVVTLGCSTRRSADFEGATRRLSTPQRMGNLKTWCIQELISVGRILRVSAAEARGRATDS